MFIWGTIKMKRNRCIRCMIMFTILLLMVVVLGACSAKEDTSTSPKESAKTSAPSERVYKHKYGETKIVGVPKKVAITLPGFVESLLAIGEKPHAMAMWGVDELAKNKGYPLIRDRLKDVIDIGRVGQFSYEALLAAGPDIILVPEYTEPHDHEKLSKIAPVVVIGEHDDNWRKQFLQIAEIYKKEEQAQKWIVEYERKVAEAKSNIKSKLGDQTAAYLSLNKKSIRLHGGTKRQFANVMYGELGIKVPPHVPMEGPSLKEISFEILPEINPDYLFINTFNDAETEALLKELQQSAIWKNLKAVKNNQVFFLRPEANFHNPLAMENHLNIIVQSLLK